MIAFCFGATTNASRQPLRIRYKLEGYDNDWRDGPGEFFFTIRFFNSAGDQVSQNIFRAMGSSAGWNGSLKTSPLTHRREMVVVPQGASRVWIVISSAGPPATVGVYAAANIVVSKISGNSPPVPVLEAPLDTDTNQDTDMIPTGWMPDGSHSSMAKIVTLRENPLQRAFAILDDDGGSHAEWHNKMASAPVVKPGDQLLVEWNEMFSMGVGDITMARYTNLVQGNYKFRAAEFDIFGMPTGVEDSIAISVPPPLWTMFWFWCVVFIGVAALAVGGNRYLVWKRMRHEMARLKSQQALEQERLRIAQDIHDDLGARVSEISLASALAKKRPSVPDAVLADFDNISAMSRELVSALYDTVWAVNPENDNLDALGNYLCQVTNQLCKQGQVRCRLRLSDLPQNIQVSSQIRHNITMSVKEAVHNVIKHSKATELTLHVGYKNGQLDVSIQDNGGGFDMDNTPGGYGVNNMRRRMEAIGGSCMIESCADTGTTVQFRLGLKTTD